MTRIANVVRNSSFILCLGDEKWSAGPNLQTIGYANTSVVDALESFAVIMRWFENASTIGLIIFTPEDGFSKETRISGLQVNDYSAYNLGICPLV